MDEMKEEFITEITKDMVLKELLNYQLSKEEVDEYLEILAAINDGQRVFSIITTENKEYLLYMKK